MSRRNKEYIRPLPHKFWPHREVLCNTFTLHSPSAQYIIHRVQVFPSGFFFARCGCFLIHILAIVIMCLCVNFQSFLGDKYGSRYLPQIIDSEEFEILLRATRTGCRDSTLMELWYFKDKNAVPPAYVLQPVTLYFPHYNDNSETNGESRKKVKLNLTILSPRYMQVYLNIQCVGDSISRDLMLLAV